MHIRAVYGYNIAMMLYAFQRNKTQFYDNSHRTISEAFFRMDTLV